MTHDHTICGSHLSGGQYNRRRLWDRRRCTQTAAYSLAWYGGTIVSRGLQNLPAEQQYDETTADFFQRAGQMLRVSPKKLEYLANQYTGWIGDIAIPALSKNRYTGEAGGLGAVLQGFSNRLTVDPAYANDVTDAFYKDRERLEQIVAATKADKPVNMLRDDLSEAERKAAYQAAYDLTHAGGAFTVAYDRVRELWDEVDAIQKTEGLSQSQKNLLARDVRMRMIGEMLVAEEAYADYMEAYVSGKSVIAAALNTGSQLTVPTAMENMPDTFKADLDSGKEYMTRAMQVWEATKEDSALPHPNDGFTSNKTAYLIPDEYRGEWDAVYRDAYEKALRGEGAKWSELSDEERLEALKAAHTKGHGAAKAWWLRYHKDEGRVE